MIMVMVVVDRKWIGYEKIQQGLRLVRYWSVGYFPSTTLYRQMLVSMNLRDIITCEGIH